MLINPPLLLDTDMVSAFAWVKRIDVLNNLYSGKMKIPQEVLNELARVPHLKAAVDSRTDTHINPLCSGAGLGVNYRTGLSQGFISHGKYIENSRSS